MSFALAATHHGLRLLIRANALTSMKYSRQMCFASVTHTILTATEPSCHSALPVYYLLLLVVLAHKHTILLVDAYLSNTAGRGTHRPTTHTPPTPHAFQVRKLDMTFPLPSRCSQDRFRLRIKTAGAKTGVSRLNRIVRLP